MTSVDGSRLGPYEIVAPLGAGGMGEVLRARDPKLGRDVAIKVLPAAFAQDAERVARFRREAQILASLNHPNIAGIHGLEESDGTIALVMELVEGEDLAQRLKRGAIPVDEAIAVAKQIAEALEEAHERGIVHRDLKPANVKVTADGKVKVLDFGLAKAMAADPMATSGSHDLSQSPTLATAAGTQAGVILGTAAYMSPEQARGKAVDKRADIWAFGVVLFEMLTGQRLFRGDTASDTLAAVLREEIPWTALPADTPTSTVRLLRRCLTRDPHDRLRDVGEARFALATAGSAPAPQAALATGPSTVARRSHSPAALAATAAVLLVVGAFAGRELVRRTAPAPPQVWMSVLPPGDVAPRMTDPAISPDGRSLAFVTASVAGGGQLYVRELGAPEARAIEGATGAVQPFWSPDGRWIGFFADGKLKKVPVAGGSPQVLADAPRARGGTWNARGDILFTPASFIPIHRTTSAGGGATPVAASASTAAASRAQMNERHSYPHFLPDGRRFLFSRGGGIAVGDLESGEVKDVAAIPSKAEYANGHLFYVKDGDLYAQPFDPDALALSGEPAKVADGIGWTAETPAGFAFTASPTGAIAFWQRSGAETRHLTWIDRTGRVLGTLGEPAAYFALALSPDERNVAVEMHEPGGGRVSVWLIDAATGTRSRFASHGEWVGLPLWSADSARVLVTDFSEALRALPVGGGAATEIPVGAGGKWPTSWTRDGRTVVFSEARNVRDIGMITADGAAQARPLVQTPFAELQGRLSPDDRWLAFQSDESGRPEIYVQAFPEGGHKRRVSTSGGRAPAWRRDGKALFHLAPDGNLVESLLVPSGDGLAVGSSRALFRPPITRDGLDRSPFAVSADGQRFLFNAIVPEEQTALITVLLGWRPAS